MSESRAAGSPRLPPRTDAGELRSVSASDGLGDDAVQQVAQQQGGGLDATDQQQLQHLADLIVGETAPVVSGRRASSSCSRRVPARRRTGAAGESATWLAEVLLQLRVATVSASSAPSVPAVDLDSGARPGLEPVAVLGGHTDQLGDHVTGSGADTTSWKSAAPDPHHWGEQVVDVLRATAGSSRSMSRGVHAFCSSRRCHVWVGGSASSSMGSPGRRTVRRARCGTGSTTSRASAGSGDVVSAGHRVEVTVGVVSGPGSDREARRSASSDRREVSGRTGRSPSTSLSGSCTSRIQEVSDHDRGVHHVAVATGDLDRLIALLPRPPGVRRRLEQSRWEAGSAVVDRIVGIEGLGGAHRRAARRQPLRRGVPVCVAGGSTRRPDRPVSDHGYTHFCLDVTDMLRQRLREDISTSDALVALNRYVFEELGFSGNADDYYDPRNSYLNDVIERKLGIPITLSVVYIEIGRRIGLPLQGVSFPVAFPRDMRAARRHGGARSVRRRRLARPRRLAGAPAADREGRRVRRAHARRRCSRPPRRATSSRGCCATSARFTRARETT